MWLCADEKKRREKGYLGADKKIRFQTLGFLCRKSRLWLCADEKIREGRRDRVLWVQR